MTRELPQNIAELGSNEPRKDVIQKHQRAPCSADVVVVVAVLRRPKMIVLESQPEVLPEDVVRGIASFARFALTNTVLFAVV